MVPLPFLNQAAIYACGSHIENPIGSVLVMYIYISVLISTLLWSMLYMKNTLSCIPLYIVHVIIDVWHVMPMSFHTFSFKILKWKSVSFLGKQCMDHMQWKFPLCAQKFKTECVWKIKILFGQYKNMSMLGFLD